AALGFDPVMILVINSVHTVYQFWIHTELIGKLGPLEWFLNTPSHHRVHHGANPQYLDKNYGGALIVWDRLFGTFAEEKEKVVYGLTKNISSYNPVYVNFHEWRDMFKDAAKAESWKDKLKHIFYPPDWRPDKDGF
ncbi:MAG: sterol desaturase family protein, partial [Bacteroidia bacterium]|nr:sterol desaturase family protein [Bacteroidia bacterium]